MNTATKPSRQANKQKDFWLLYPSTNRSGTFADIVYALYYLPENYKLMILSEDTAQDQMDMAKYEDLKTRIQLETETGLSAEASPFSFAHALISDDATPEIIRSTVKSQVVVSGSAKQDIQRTEADGFTVPSGNSPALASAVLRIAHAA